MVITRSILKLEKCNGYQNLQKNISNYVRFMSFLSHLNGFWVIYKNGHFYCDQKLVSPSHFSVQCFIAYTFYCELVNNLGPVFKNFAERFSSALWHLAPCFNQQFIVHQHNTLADNDQLLILMCSYMMWQWFYIPAGKLRKRSWTKFWERWFTTPG